MPTDSFILSGEGPRLAFVHPADADLIAETMVAFANTEGGTIIIGPQAAGEIPATASENHDIGRLLRRADDLYNPPVVIEDWEAIVNSRRPINCFGRTFRRRQWRQLRLVAVMVKSQVTPFAFRAAPNCTPSRTVAF